jgi:hypothetical protein
MSGLFCRIMFEQEMNAIENLCGQFVDDNSQLWLFKKFSHTLNSFTFKKSTPSAASKSSI